MRPELSINKLASTLLLGAGLLLCGWPARASQRTTPGDWLIKELSSFARSAPKATKKALMVHVNAYRKIERIEDLRAPGTLSQLVEQVVAIREPRIEQLQSYLRVLKEKSPPQSLGLMVALRRRIDSETFNLKAIRVAGETFGQISDKAHIYQGEVARTKVRSLAGGSRLLVRLRRPRSTFTRSGNLPTEKATCWPRAGRRWPTCRVAFC